MTGVRRSTAILLIIALAWPYRLLAAAGAGPITADAEEYVEVTRELQQHVDTARLDPQAMLDRLDYEPGEILAYVSSGVGFEQYPGTMRGALGTLMSRSGNALDQALLLATLLRDAGADARIVRGRIAEDDAQRLLEQMQHRPDQGEAFPLEEVLSLLGRTYHPDARKWFEAGQPPASTQQMIDEIATTLAEAVPAPNSAEASLQALTEEARDYFWVEYRDAASAPWTAAHPAFGDTAPPESAKASEYYAEAIPETLQHRFRVRVFVETLVRDELKAWQITPDWERPVANMVGKVFSIGNQPLDLDVTPDAKDSLDQLRTAFDKVEVFAPVVNGSILPGSKAFDLDGVLVDMDVQAMAGGMGGALFRTVGSKTDRAAAALDALGTDRTREQLRYLTAQWIEYTLIPPGGGEKTFRRYLYDAIGPAARDSGKLSGLTLARAEARALMSHESYAIDSGRLPADTVLKDYTDWMVVDRKMELLNLSGELTLRRIEKVAGDTNNPESLHLLSLLRHFDARLQADPGMTYRSAPSLVALHVSTADPGKIQVTTDIMHNERRSRQWRDPVLARAQVMHRGVWESYIERFAAENWLYRPVIRDSFGVFAERASAELKHYQPGAVPGHREPPQGFGADAGHILMADANHNVVLARDLGPEDFEAWWRVDPVSGSVIGVLGDGRGATIAEALTLGILVAIGTIFAAGAYKCMAVMWEEAKVCIDTKLNLLTGDFAKSYVETHFSECVRDQTRPWADERELKCHCGTLGRDGEVVKACPEWMTP